MGRNTSGVKGIRLGPDDQLVGMVVANPEATLLTACLNGYGKRTPFGPNLAADAPPDEASQDGPDEALQDTPDEPEEETASGQRYRTQRRGGKGVRDIKATARNGPVVGIVRVGDDDELMMVTARGKLQRVLASDLSVIGRNTQGVRIMRLDQGDTLTAVVRVLRDINEGENGGGDAVATASDHAAGETAGHDATATGATASDDPPAPAAEPPEEKGIE